VSPNQSHSEATSASSDSVSVTFSDSPSAQASEMASLSATPSQAPSTIVSQSVSHTNTPSVTPSHTSSLSVSLSPTVLPSLAIWWTNVPAPVTSSSNVSFSFNASDPSRMCGVSVVIDNITQLVAVSLSFTAFDLSSGNHAAFVSLHDCITSRPLSLSYSFSIFGNVVSLVPMHMSLFSSYDTVSHLLQLLESPLSNASLLVSPRDCPREPVTVSCESNESTLATVAPRHVVLGPDCHRSPVSIIDSYYVVQRLQGTVTDIIRPLFQDILLLQPATREWTSSLSPTNQFVCTTSTSTPAVIVGDSSFRSEGHGPHFSNQTTVRIGGVLVNSVTYLPNLTAFFGDQNQSLPWVPDTDGLLLDLPSYESMCGKAPANACAQLDGYKTVVLSNNDFDFNVVSCPQLCPGGLPTSHFGGIYYSETCVGYETGPVCFAAETSRRCAFGSGDSCRRCPTGAVCPGGSRLW
jgi:hypothetical protein